MIEDLLYIEGQLEIVLATLPEDIPTEAASGLLGALLRVRKAAGRYRPETPSTGILEPLEAALADLESHTHGATLQSTWGTTSRSHWYRAGMADGYRGALRYVEAAHQTIADNLQEVPPDHATR